jgi:hypothetical protein
MHEKIFIELKNRIESEWLLNPEWKVLPSIAFVSRVHKVLTCMDHKGGSKLFHIHKCRQPIHNLSAAKSDQLCHGVIRTRTVKPMKKSEYSDSYQMHE